MVDDCFWRIAFVPVVGDAAVALALGEFLTVEAEDQAEMNKLRRLRFQSPVQ